MVMTTLTWFEWSASLERITGHVSRATANWRDTTQLTVRVETANSGARIYTLLSETSGFAAGTFRMMRTFRLTSSIRISKPILQIFQLQKKLNDNLLFLKKTCKSGFQHCFLTSFTKFFLRGSMLPVFGFLTEEVFEYVEFQNVIVKKKKLIQIRLKFKSLD